MGGLRGGSVYAGQCSELTGHRMRGQPPPHGPAVWLPFDPVSDSSASSQLTLQTSIPGFLPNPQASSTLVSRPRPQQTLVLETLRTSREGGVSQEWIFQVKEGQGK